MQMVDPYASLPDPTKTATPAAGGDPYANMPDPYANMSDAAQTPTTPAGWKAKLDAMFAPSTEAGSGVWGRVRAAVKGPLGTLEQTVVHPFDTLAGMGAGAMAGSTPYGTPLTSSTGNKDIDEKNERVYGQVRTDVVNNAREALQDHPVYTASSIITPMLIGEGTKAVRGGGERPTPAGLRKYAQKIIGVGARPLSEAVGKVADKAAVEAERTRAANKAADETTLAKRGKVDEANVQRDTKNEQIAKKGRAENAAKLKEHQAAVAEHEAKVRQAKDTERIRQQTMDEHAKLSAEQEKAHQAAEAKAKKENDANWDRWRAKVAKTMANMQSVVDVIRAQARLLGDPARVAEFRQVLSETKPGEGDLSEVGQLRNQLAQGQGYGESYDRLTPERQKVINDLVERMGLDGSEEESGLKELPASRLHGIKADLEARIRTSEGPVKFALGKVLDAVREKEAEVSEAAGATAELEKARASHGPYVDTFRNSPNEPQTVASKSLAENSPEYQREQARQRRLEMLGNYDESIPARAEKLRSLQRTLEGLPSQKETAAMMAAEPPSGPDYTTKTGDIRPVAYGEPEANKPIERPDVDLQKTREEMIRNAASRWRQTSQYQIRRLAASGISGALAAFTGHNALEGAAVGYTAAEFAPKGLAALVEQPRVLQWLSQPSVEDIQAVRTLPNVDQVNLRNGLTKIATDAAKAGKRVALSDSVKGFLGSSNVALILAAHPPATAGEAKRRMQEAMATR